jgi:hypothetical protein
MQSRVDPGSQHCCCAASGPREEKGPNLIPSRSHPRADDRSSSLVILTKFNRFRLCSAGERRAAFCLAEKNYDANFLFFSSALPSIDALHATGIASPQVRQRPRRTLRQKSSGGQDDAFCARQFCSQFFQRRQTTPRPRRPDDRAARLPRTPQKARPITSRPSRRPSTAPRSRPIRRPRKTGRPSAWTTRRRVSASLTRSAPTM